MKVWYLVASVEGPYNRGNPQRPKYVRELKANWVGNPVGGYFVVMANTTQAKHDKLAGYGDVYPLTDRSLGVLVSDLSPSEKKNIQSALGEVSLPYYASETVGALLQRMIMCKLMGIPNVGRTTQLKNLSSAAKQATQELLGKWGMDCKGDETIQQIVDRCGGVLCPVDRWDVEEF